MLKLNLGAGRHSFPLTRGQEPHPEHLLPLYDAVYEPGWVNVDKFKFPETQEQVNLFRFPWVRSSNGAPWNDDTFDHIHAGHLVEHVPHQVQVADGLPPQWTRRYGELCANYDGFFVFFAECWRILKPGGTMHIRAPYAFSIPGVADPTHTRLIVPGVFTYLEGQDDPAAAPFDYHLPCRFKIAGVTLRFREPWNRLIDRVPAQKMFQWAARFIDVADELKVDLVAVKEPGAG